MIKLKRQQAQKPTKFPGDSMMIGEVEHVILNRLSTEIGTFFDDHDLIRRLKKIHSFIIPARIFFKISFYFTDFFIVHF